MLDSDVTLTAHPAAGGDLAAVKPGDVITAQFTIDLPQIDVNLRSELKLEAFGLHSATGESVRETVVLSPGHHAVSSIIVLSHLSPRFTRIPCLPSAHRSQRRLHYIK